MNRISQEELEKRTNLDFETILNLYLTGEISDPLLFASGKYEWHIDSIASFIVPNFDRFNISPENQKFWTNFIKMRDAQHEKESIRAPKKNYRYLN